MYVVLGQLCRRASGRRASKHQDHYHHHPPSTTLFSLQNTPTTTTLPYSLHPLHSYSTPTSDSSTPSPFHHSIHTFTHSHILHNGRSERGKSTAPSLLLPVVVIRDSPSVAYQLRPCDHTLLTTPFARSVRGTSKYSLFSCLCRINLSTARPSSPGCASRLNATMVSRPWSLLTVYHTLC